MRLACFIAKGIYIVSTKVEVCLDASSELYTKVKLSDVWADSSVWHVNLACEGPGDARPCDKEGIFLVVDLCG